MSTGVAPAELERLTGRARAIGRSCRASLHESAGWVPGAEEDRRSGVFGAARSNRHPPGPDGRFTVVSPYPERLLVELVLWDRDNRPMLWSGPTPLDPGEALSIDPAAIEVW